MGSGRTFLRKFHYLRMWFGSQLKRRGCRLPGRGSALGIFVQDLFKIRFSVQSRLAG